MLRGDQCYQVVKAVEIGPVVGILDRLSFVSVGGSSASKYKCDVVLRDHFPQEVRDLMASLDLGGMTARAIIRRLAPGQSIPPHIDDWMPGEADWRRFQVPLVSDPRIVMRWPDDGQELYLAPGFLYEVRFDRVHEVTNGADVDRLHLQIDQVNATI